jgi:alpha-galactosidase
LKGGAKAIGVFNLDDKPVKLAIPLAGIGLQSGQMLRDCWRQRDLGKTTNSYTVEVPAHGVVLLKATGGLH